MYARNFSLSCVRLISIPICAAAFGQAQGLSITNYQVVSEQTSNRALNVTYRADLVNTGAAIPAVTATATIPDASTVTLVAGQNTLQFPAVPANGQVTSSNTFTLQIGTTLPVDFSLLQWAFQTAAILLPASVALTPGETVNFPLALGTPAPEGGVFITLASSNPSTATVSPTTFFVSQGLMAAPRVVTTVTGDSAGSATITASTAGYATASSQVQVTGGGTTAASMSFWPGSLAVNAATTQNLTLNLSTPAAAAFGVNLSSSASAVATVPAAVNFLAGATTVSVPVTGVSAGSVTITASAQNMANATASVTVTPSVTGAILLPSTVTVAVGNAVNFPVALGTAAPAGGVMVTLASNSPSTATVYPSTLFVSPGATTAPGVVTTVSGGSAGSTAITASAPGYATVSSPVQVTSGGTPATTMSFSPGTMTINGAATQNLILNLSKPAAAALVVNLNSSIPTVATVPATVSFGIGMATVAVPVTAVAGGSVTITASAPNIAGATAALTVTQPAAGGILLPVSVTVTPGGTANFPVTLGTAAPAGGVSITLASSNPSVATVSPSTVSIAQGTTAARRSSTIVSGIGNGSATITASAFGYPTASFPVQVAGGPAATISFTPANLTITGAATQNLTLNLSASVSSLIVVNLSSSAPTVATVPATVSFGAGATSVPVPVTGVSAGSATITASVINIGGAAAGVIVTQIAGAIQVHSATVGVGQSAELVITLPAAAPAGGVTVSLASSDTSKATVPATVFIPAGHAFPATQPLVSGVGVGSASITASAPGFASGSAQVQVTTGGGYSFFTPMGGLTINVGSTQDLTLNLSSAPAPPIAISVSSSNPSVATVPVTVTTTAGSAAVTVPVTGVAGGSVTITASTASYGTATSSVTVPSLNGVSVTWYGACWETATIDGISGNFQGIDFSLQTPTPVVVNGSLFYAANCDPNPGVDNMNDTGAVTGSGHMIQGFVHHPDLIPSSAIYWIGSASTDGTTCPAGSLCSGCVNYSQATPNCSSLP